MTPRTLLAAIAVVAAAGPAAPGFADTPSVSTIVPSDAFDPAGWTRLGTKQLSGARTRDLITLTRGGGKLDQLTFVVDGDLDLSGITVMTSGGKLVVRGAQHHFWASSPSKQVELTGNTRALRSIGVMYQLPAAATATVTVYGRRSATAAPPASAAKRDEAPTRTIALAADTDAAPAISAREGWTLLGAQTVDGTHDADVIRVPTDVFGLFTQVAIVVSGGELELSTLRLRMAGGQVADIGTKYHFRADQPIRIITLPDARDGQVVRLIQLRYGAERGRGKTRVALWAR